MKQSYAIEVENLVAHYGDREILHGISLSIHEGEVMVIMGGSGSGKSTLLKHLLGLMRPSSGEVKLLGHDINKMSDIELQALRCKTGVAFQGGALLSSLTVGENIMLPLMEHTELDTETMEIMARLKMELVELSGFENLMPSELSGGMIKRAALARAIVMDPQILYCDEPSAGLDPVVAATIDDLILTLRDTIGMTIVVVTHELDSAFKIADRICVLDKGNILMVGSVEEIKNSDNERIQNLLNRKGDNEKIDSDEYIRRLTGKKIYS